MDNPKTVDATVPITTIPFAQLETLFLQILEYTDAKRAFDAKGNASHAITHAVWFDRYTRLVRAETWLKAFADGLRTSAEGAAWDRLEATIRPGERLKERCRATG
jgi:hypothetical protein